MNTKAILSAAAWCALTLAQAQEGTTPVQPSVQQQPPAVQAPVAPQQSLYHDCLVVAGTSTWTTLGLDAQQQSRVADLQARYKAALNPPKEEKTKGKKGKEATAKASKATTAPPVSTQVTTPIDKETMDPMKEKVEEGTVEASAPDPNALPQLVSVDDELRTILTPEQMALWEKQCSHNEPVGVVTP
ncbi:MAG TPA: hypothetical protein VKG92_10670 [Flavobacteriales bacterium]|nr:hypothetical protein [Flavobacteriales bacterium]